ncbi:ABC-type metal ion transport system, periplas mic component AdcA [Peptoclostridium acidaminophilum DSM 3953]|uniref:ABC-type metal ion transport system, periplas mic component AdcA n=1 Tax=Peptoclostridium acidaminophilum DSM 3953 TaxID=1286171 RepID=W8TLF7_PEPAC|nr:zinc ABC transporter substrate-binding protein [Peptoclostridium acidaminophilum]AHM57027.1 ABC-type metal ion transport system, periplas mic component AdcA [Peptoclostridium acidaminophilum DSM 3953]
MLSGKKLLILLLAFAAAIFSACGQDESVKSQKPVIAVSIPPQEEFIRAIAGDSVAIVTIIPPGSSPETYQPSPKQMQLFSSASIYFAMGVPAEEANILPKARELNPDAKVVRLDDEVKKIYPELKISGHAHEDGEEIHEEGEALSRDPHIWMSPKRVIVMLDVMASELSMLYPENSDLYSSNAKSYKKKLIQLDASIKSELSIAKQKEFIIYHPSLGYFANDYGLTMIAVESEGKDATARQLQYIVDLAKERGIKVIFHQAEIASAQSRTLADEIGGKVVEITPLSADYIKNMEKIAATFKEVLE